MMWGAGQLLQSGKYRIKRQIGGGGFGLTYLAEDCFLHRQVVIKTPNQTFETDQDYEGFVRRFQREGQALAKISHPNVVQVIEIFKEAGMPCLVMIYVEGETLNECVRRQGRLSQDEAVQVFRKLAEALHQLHQAGLIHCDLHPGNIILRPDREPVLIDFGSAKLLQPSTFTVTTTVNESFTPYEQRQQGGKPQPTLDVYGLAATLYFAVTGQKPEAAVNRKLYGDTLKSPQQCYSNLSGWLEQAILKGMALEAAERPSSMEVWTSLLRIPTHDKAQPGPWSHPIKNTPPPKKPNQIKLNFSWIAVFFLILVYAATGFVIGRSNSDSWAWIWAVTWAVAWAWTVAMGVAWASWAVAWIMGVAWASWAVAVAVAGAWAGAWAWAMAGAWAGAWAGTGAWAGEEAWPVAVVVALLGGMISGHFTGISAWAGLGIGLLGFIEWFIITTSSFDVSESLEKRYPSFTVFIIISVISILGLGFGGSLGWQLTLSGFKLPI